jgi:hypothetical protein
MIVSALRFSELQRDIYDKQGIVGAQTKGQFHMIYGTEGTQALFTGLATQIVYGDCDHDTADFFLRNVLQMRRSSRYEPHVSDNHHSRCGRNWFRCNKG